MPLERTINVRETSKPFVTQMKVGHAGMNERNAAHDIEFITSKKVSLCN